MENPERVWGNLSQVSIDKEGYLDDHADSRNPTEELTSGIASDRTFSTTNPNDVCPSCSHPVSNEEPAVKCDSCQTWNHTECEDMSHEDYNHLMKDECADIPWYCGNCLMFGIAEMGTKVSLQAVHSKTSMATRMVPELSPSIHPESPQDAHQKATSTLNNDGDFSSSGMDYKGQLLLPLIAPS